MSDESGVYNQRYEQLAIVGAGPSAVFILQHLLSISDAIKELVVGISLFDQSSHLGMGTPFNPETTDGCHLSNISSAEIPPLPESLEEWLLKQDDTKLSELNVNRVEISDSAIFSRLTIGCYFARQLEILVNRLEKRGFSVFLKSQTEVMSVIDKVDENLVSIKTSDGVVASFNRVVIATGHSMLSSSTSEAGGYFPSPWPINKILPKGESFYNHAMGVLGASLSAIDVAFSLAERHGDFHNNSDGMTYQLRQGAEHCEVVMHCENGWLPQLQFEQVMPIREIYRHVSAADIAGLVDREGFLRLERYFDKACRPALIKAFVADGAKDRVALLKDKSCDLRSFISALESDHASQKQFECMERELAKVKVRTKQSRPTCWKEVLDDLMYTLNFHAEKMSAEDHLQLRQEVMPIVMCIMAALPVESADRLLALHKAGFISVIAGHAKVKTSANGKSTTTVKVKGADGQRATYEYPVFVDCSGAADPDYGHELLSDSAGLPIARPAKAYFAAPNPTKVQGQQYPSSTRSTPEQEPLDIGGIDINEVYQIIGFDGSVNPRISCTAPEFLRGIRPYYYGLQACNEVAKFVVQSLVRKALGYHHNSLHTQ